MPPNQPFSLPKPNPNFQNSPTLKNSHASQNTSSFQNPTLQTLPIFQNPPIGATYPHMDLAIEALKEQLASQ